MKSKLFFLFLGFSLVFLQAQDSLSLEQKMLMSQLDATNETKDKRVDDEETGIWTLFIRKFGSEKVMVRFPKKPEFHCNIPKENFSIQCQAEKATYQMMVDPLGTKDIGSVFDDSIQSIKRNKSLYLQEFKQDGNTLDLIVANSQDHKMLYKTRMFVTNEHIYQLTTKIKSGVQDQHQYFVQSFQIVYDEIA